MTLDDNIFKDVFLGPYNNLVSPLTPVSKMLVSLDGIHSGVPTRTTSTLTPTTLRNIEQTFLELTSDTANTVPCQAGFVPPLPTFHFEQESQDHSLGSTGSNSSESWSASKHDEENSSEAITIEKSSNSKRNMGGRKPASSSNLSPEEEEKRRVRRERNKLAAARCRKRRVDQTNDLMGKVNLLEAEKGRLEKDIQDLQAQKEDIQFILESHLSQCKLASAGLAKVIDMKPKLDFKEPQTHIPLVEKIKVEVDDDFKMDSYDERDTIAQPPAKRILLSTANPIIGSAITNASIINPSLQSVAGKPSRPSSLNVPYQMPPSHAIGMTKNIADIAGVQITTPSNVCAFNFDSLMDGGTGLTPIKPTCSTQNKSPLDLVTPTSEPSKLVSL